MKLKNLTIALPVCFSMFALTSTISCKKQQMDVASAPQDRVATTEASAEVTKSGSTWTAKVNGVTKYTGTDYIGAIQAACNNLTAGRTSKETVTIRSSGSSGNSGGSIKAVNIPSYTILDFAGTTFNSNSNDALIVPIQGDRKTQIEVRNITITGTPRYAIWFKGCSNMTITNITMRLTPALAVGLGIRVDYSTGASRNLTINGNINISGSGDNAIETYGVDGFSIGDVTATNTGACGVLLNKSTNGSVGTVTGNYNCQNGGYATFRCANQNGPNVTCKKVYSRYSGRGFFSVTGSNGCTVGTVDIANSTSHGIYLQDASNTRVNAGTVSSGHPNVQFRNSTSCRVAVNGQVYTATNGIW